MYELWNFAYTVYWYLNRTWFIIRCVHVVFSFETIRYWFYKMNSDKKISSFKSKVWKVSTEILNSSSKNEQHLVQKVKSGDELRNCDVFKINGFVYKKKNDLDLDDKLSKMLIRMILLC